MRAYAIGDIHGQFDKLLQAHDWIAADMAHHGPAPVIHLGDLVDRGPDSAGVIGFLIQGQQAGQDWRVIKGNHDRMFTTFLQDATARDPGLRSDLDYMHPKIGGGPTLASYGIHAPMDRPTPTIHAEAQQAVPLAHRDWLLARPAQIALGPWLFVHAGIRPGLPFADQTETDLVWIREPFLSDPRDHGALIVHGHTALDAPQHYGNRLNLDSGAGYGRALTAVALEGPDVFVLGPKGRQPLHPAQA